MKRRNEFLRFTRLHHENDGTGGSGDNNELDTPDDEQSDASDIIDKAKEEVDYKELLKKQEEEIALLKAEKEQLIKKPETKKGKPIYLTKDDIDRIWDEKEQQKAVVRKLESYGLSSDELNKAKNLPPEALEFILSALGKKSTLPNTRKIGDGKSGYSKNLNSVDDILKELEGM